MLGVNGHAWTHPVPASLSMAQQAPQQPAQHSSAKTVTGKVTAVAKTGLAFSMETGNGPAKHSMQFTVDKNTQVQGRVTTGTVAKVKYHVNDTGSNVAETVAAQ